MDAARRAGVGLHINEWHIEPGAAPAELLEWCRTTMAHARRPWGVNRFDLTIVANCEDGRFRQHLRRLEPAILYDGGLLARLSTLFEGLPHGRVTVAVGLCSWGDLAYEVLVRDPAAR